MAELTTKQTEKIIHLLSNGTAERDIANKLKITRYKVRVVIEDMRRKRIEEQVQKKAIDKLEDYREQLINWSTNEQASLFLMKRRLQEFGVDVSESTIKRFISKKKSEVYIHLKTNAGEEAQVDFGYLGRFNKKEKEVKVWVFCMVLSHSRYAYYSVVTEQTTLNFIKCHQQAFSFFGGVPKTVKIDNLAAAVNEAHSFEPTFQRQYEEFMNYYRCGIITARICRGQDKGKAEAGIKYVKGNFLKKLSHRNFERLVTDLEAWNKNECNLRRHGATHKIPHEEFINHEKKKLLPLPNQEFKVVEKSERIVDKFGHIFHTYNFYSVPAHYAYEKVCLESDGKLLKIFKSDRQIASHTILEGKGKYSTMEIHKPMYKQTKNIQYYEERVKKIGRNALNLLDILVTNKPYHWKNKIKGILRLAEVYTARIVDIACEKAITDGSPDFRTVQKILIKNLYTLPTPASSHPKGTNGFYHPLSVYDELAKKINRQQLKLTIK